MRIIGGKHKGRKLLELKCDGVRPTLDRVRENLFNILYPNVSNSTFLDLFTGSGAVGFEAISRGAKEVVFADKSNAVIQQVKKNAEIIGEKPVTICADYKTVLKRLSGKKFDIIYLDPPYGFCEEELFSDLSNSDILDDSSIVVYEHKSENPLKNPNEWFIMYDERKYGIATLTFMRKKNG
ncbi:MAG: 16S rRNA (guanine(966)-N(2))-methyltransferase RsmD [Clostridia bacterium]|nr:16S rRNA (guanine(966)-N(2))-methyltransferase RsmD [Clostridia bacterium]